MTTYEKQDSPLIEGLPSPLTSPAVSGFASTFLEGVRAALRSARVAARRHGMHGALAGSGRRTLVCGAESDEAFLNGGI